jgi:hypothetical protein
MATMEVPVAGGFVALVDEEDYPLVSGRDWFVRERAGCRYAVSKGVLMHRLILNAKRGQIVDHASGDGLDNRRENIRICTHAQNMQNRRKSATATVTKYKGVSVLSSRARRARPYQAEIEAFGERVFLGSFLTAEKAAKAYDRAARIFHGKFARTNAGLGLL